LSASARPPVRPRDRAISVALIVALALVAAIPLVALYRAFGPR
jgi:hypothetical protein